MKNIFEDKKSIENLIDGTMQNLHSLVEANTIIGEPIISGDGSVIIPISKVSVGYVVGGGEFSENIKRKKNSSLPLAGGSGGGVSISPVGFLIKFKGEVKFIDIENKTASETILKLLNKLADKMTKKENIKE